ncbi:MAG: hypothetical protein COA84_05355 [Robiginitomaculum sp.]|nr:MAG: hypothetical protein COA84_05355 [Robiginitomaculum sp.]
MLNLLGILLKAIISLAIGIIGFTWEPKESIETPSEKEKRSEHIIPVSLNAPTERLRLMQSVYQKSTGCAAASPSARATHTPLRRMDNITDQGVAI